MNHEPHTYTVYTSHEPCQYPVGRRPDTGALYKLVAAAQGHSRRNQLKLGASRDGK